jgi:Polyketide cyclase / dehydrase and lipid transport
VFGCAIRVHNFPFAMRSAASGKFGTYTVRFFPLGARAMSKGKKCTLHGLPITPPSLQAAVDVHRYPQQLVMPRATATTTVPGRTADAEALWYDANRWAAWIDGFGHVVKLEGDWPHPGARLQWDSPPAGRGRVVEHVIAYEPRAGQTVEVEDERLEGTQTVSFEPAGDGVRVTVVLDYRLKQRGLLTPVLDALFIRRSLRASLMRTLTRFGHERRAELDFTRR